MSHTTFFTPLGYQLFISLFLTLLLSVTFRFVTTSTAISRISRTTRQRLTICHAFAIEGLQLLIAASTLYQLYFSILPTFNLSMALSVVRLLTLFFRNSMAIFAIDFIDTFVVLGTIRHPVQLQTFVLTRKRLWPTLVRLWVLSGKSGPGMPLPKQGGMISIARRCLGLQFVETIVLLQPRTRKQRNPSKTAASRTLIRTTSPRRNSFPYHLLNT